MIVHLLDDEKILSSIINFNIYEIKVDHTFVIYTNKERLESLNKEYHAIPNILFISSIKDIPKELKKIEVTLIAHSLNYWKCKAIYEFRKIKKIAWIFWGADGYNLIAIKKNIYQEITNKKIIRKQKGYFRTKIKHFLFPIYKLYSLYILKSLDYDTILRMTIPKIDYFVTTLPQDYHLFKKYIKEFNSTFIPYIYYSYEEIIAKNLLNKNVEGNGILFGNSSYPTNNHLDGLVKLSKIPLGNKKIYTPLSYGDLTYCEKVIEIGTKLFNDNFKPIKEFMPLNKYTLILQKCPIVIMNHDRQQAVGNIIASLYLGAKVYLSKNNTLYKYLKDLDLIIYSIDFDLNLNNKFALEPLHPSEQLNNRRIVMKVFSKKNKIQLSINLFNTLSK
ncbi:TDP-N-acetylfucosamine:lipid II N-acetylfucosaminyltransferase [Carboxylicivirga sp. N1Y90]|uniref:TDP-N-acetylfucosamine:lipid II N-acetylfucosaminyltransferase n=1 Tax=Carboxylicivirga fragile TaxID=3417571 RepID=UPI003D34AFCF|nr:TDP-N-acetylfucosamine:lipid II N-acetylfucosaminyltransferase [Marinilabiliaceae bacterium N1Y90]